MVLDNNNNLGWGPEVLGLAGQNFGPKLAAAPPGWFDKRSWTSGFSGGMGKRVAVLEPAVKRKKRWTTQAIRGMWGKRATKEMAEPSFMEDSLVGKPFAFTDLACFYPWCQTWPTK